jgi:uncharacterized protein YcfL
MKKILFLLTLVALVSCGTENSKNGGTTDSLSVVNSDSTVGTKIDSTKVDSAKVDSIKSLK